MPEVNEKLTRSKERGAATPKRKGGRYLKELSPQTQSELHDKIIRLLEEENCTVRQAKAILCRVGRTIEGTAAVQFVPDLNYEF